MQVFYTKATAEHLTPEILSRLAARLGELTTDIETIAAPTAHQSEIFHREIYHELRFKWLGFRLSDAARLIGVIVTQHDVHYFFALDYTKTHDYRKTLVNNLQRANSWRHFIADFLATFVPTIPTPTQQLVQHQHHFKIPDAQQTSLINTPINQGLVCFGSPGSGKTLIALQRAVDYLSHQLQTLLITPNAKLALSMQQELREQHIDLAATNSQCCAFEDVLTLINPHYPELNLSRNGRILVDFSYFKSWCDTLPKKQQPHPSQRLTLWQEFQDVFMYADWNNPRQPYRTLDDYIALGRNQSNIPSEHKTECYQQLFLPFFKHLQSHTDRLYYPVTIAHQLYQAIIESPKPISFDAMVIDEIQRFHPWQWACLLSLLKNPLMAGQFFICGDAHQSVDCLSLRMAEHLKQYFRSMGAPFNCHQLELNHRNAQAISRWITQIHGLEYFCFGSIERDTHAPPILSSEEPEGHLDFVNPLTFDRNHINTNADAYVLIPDESWRESAKTYWNQAQIVTLQQFAGLSAPTLLIFGFATHYQPELSQILKHFSLETWTPTDTTPFARKARRLDFDIQPLRTCLQAFYTASSRAIQELIFFEPPETTPHPLLRTLLNRSAPSCADGAATLSLTPDVKPSTPLQWFLRAQENYQNGLHEQAWAILSNSSLWLPEHITLIQAHVSELDNPSTWDTIQQCLFPEVPQTDVSKAPATLDDAFSIVEIEKEPDPEPPLPTAVAETLDVAFSIVEIAENREPEPHLPTAAAATDMSLTLAEEWDLDQFKEFNPATIYTFAPKINYPTQRPWHHDELASIMVTMHDLLIHPVGQIQDLFSAYQYAEQTFLPWLRTLLSSSDPISSAESTAFQQHLKTLHRHLSKTLLQQKAPESIGEYRSKSSLKWIHGAELSPEFLHYFSNTHECSIPRIFAEYIHSYKPKLGVQQILDFLVVMDKIKTIRLTETLPITQEGQDLDKKHHSGWLTLKKLEVAYYAPYFLTAEEKAIIDKVVVPTMPPEQTPEKMEEYSLTLLNRLRVLPKDLDATVLFITQFFYQLKQIKPFFKANVRTAFCLLNILLRSLGYPSIPCEKITRSNPPTKEGLNYVEKLIKKIILKEQKCPSQEDRYARIFDLYMNLLSSIPAKLRQDPRFLQYRIQAPQLINLLFERIADPAIKTQRILQQLEKELPRIVKELDSPQRPRIHLSSISMFALLSAQKKEIITSLETFTGLIESWKFCKSEAYFWIQLPTIYAAIDLQRDLTRQDPGAKIFIQAAKKKPEQVLLYHELNPHIWLAPSTTSVVHGK